MSLELALRTVNQLDKDIVTLEKKLTELIRKEADKTKRISSIQKTITSKTSLSTLKSKSNQIQRYQNEIVKILKDKADISKKIADKKSKLSDSKMRLQREEKRNAKALAALTQNKIDAYEEKISELTMMMTNPAENRIINKNLYNTDSTEEYDVFISHATEDKESFCNEFVEILQSEYGLRVWYDSEAISWGDSIRTEIDKGLKKSRFGIIILSKHYIEKYWTNYELESLFQIESTGGKVILPIWHDITKKQIQDFSPLLAGKAAMNTALMTPEEIASKLNEFLSNSITKEI